MPHVVLPRNRIDVMKLFVLFCFTSVKTKLNMRKAPCTKSGRIQERHMENL